MAIPEIIAKKKMKRYEPMTDNMFLIPLIIFIKTLPHLPIHSNAKKLIAQTFRPSPIIKNPALSLF